jgi:NADPH-dependent glutamate synthase beta subunit-like oxidoreductase
LQRLEGEAFSQVARGTGEPLTIPCGLVLTSIGYKSTPMSSVPFDERSATVPSTAGRVAGEERLYVAGWMKRGPTGIVGTNIPDAKVGPGPGQRWQAQ